MIYKKYELETYNIYTIKTNKFKTCHMEIIFRNNIVKNNITKRNLLTELLVENSKKYNTRKKMTIELEELYNSYFYGITNRIGSSILTNFCFDFINPNLVNEQINEFIKFPLEVLYNPNINNNEFDNTTFNYIKDRVKKDIESIIEDPKKYSINELVNTMCPNTETSINVSGYIEDLDLITNSNIYDYYNYMLTHDYIDIYIIGDLDMDKVVKIIKDNLKLNVLKNHKINYEVKNNTNNKIKNKSLIKDFSQENICVGLNIKNISLYEKNYVAQVYNMILGGGSLDTKLYTNLRNKNSLCYNCTSLYQKFDNIFIIHTAISKENESQTIKLIEQSLKDMINNITEDELDNAKKMITTTLNMSLDNPGRIVDNYLFKNLYGLDDLEIRINNYNKITIKDIENFAKKVSINTILCIRDGENEKN